MALVSENLSLGSKPALILVDMINGFTDPACELGSACAEVISANQALLAVFRQRSWPVFFSTVVYHNESQASVFRRKLPALNCLQANSHWVEVDPALARIDSEPLIEKQWASAFFGTELAEQLTACGADSLVVTGLTTSGCVRATAVDGLQYNYPVVIPREAVGDRTTQVHEANLYDLKAKYVEVTSLNQVLEQLSSIQELHASQETDD